MRARMATITYHAPYNQHTIATRNQGDNVSSMLPILGSGDGSCSALETACGHKRALRGHKPQPLTAKTHPPARPMAWCDRTRPPGLCPPARAGNLGLLAAAHSPPLGTRGSRAQLRAPCTTTAAPVRSLESCVAGTVGGPQYGLLTSEIGANQVGTKAVLKSRKHLKIAVTHQSGEGCAQRRAALGLPAVQSPRPDPWAARCTVSWSAQPLQHQPRREC